MAIFAPRYKEAQAEFEMLEEDLRELGKLCEPQLSKPENAPWRLITTDGVVVRTWSLENPESVRSVNLELAMVVEAGGCPCAGIERIRGRVAARRGPIIYNGTIEHAQTWWRDWQAIGQRPNTKHIKTFIIPSWANRIEFRAFAGSLNKTKVAGYIMLCLGLVELAMNTTRCAGCRPHVSMSRAFMRLPWHQRRSRFNSSMRFGGISS